MRSFKKYAGGCNRQEDHALDQIDNIARVSLLAGKAVFDVNYVQQLCGVGLDDPA